MKERKYGEGGSDGGREKGATLQEKYLSPFISSEMSTDSPST